VPFFCIASDSSKPFPFSSVVSELKFDSLFLTGPVNLRICFPFPCHIWITAGMKMASQLQLSLQTQHQLWLFWDLLWWGLGTRKSYCPPPVSFSWLPLLEAATHGVIFPFWSLVWIHVFTCWIIIYLFIYFFVNYCVWWFFFSFLFFWQYWGIYSGSCAFICWIRWEKNEKMTAGLCFYTYLWSKEPPCGRWAVWENQIAYWGASLLWKPGKSQMDMVDKKDSRLLWISSKRLQEAFWR
jgi:hypothetical protein